MKPAKRFTDRLPLLEWIILVVTILIAIGSWILFIVVPDPTNQNWAAWSYTSFGALTLGAAIQIALMMYFRSTGTWRQRFSLTESRHPLGGLPIVILAPAVVVGLVMTLSWNTDLSGFGSDMNHWGTVGVLTLLVLLFTTIGAGVIYCLVLMPIGFLIAAAMPFDHDSEQGLIYTEWSKGQLLAAGLLLPVVTVIGVAMTLMGLTTSGTMRGRMAEQFANFVTGNGPVVPTATVIIGIASVIALVSLNNVSYRKHMAKQFKQGIYSNEGESK